MTEADRRPIATRQTAWAQALARQICRTGLTPNAISGLSVVFAVGAGAALAVLPIQEHPGIRAALLVAAAVGVQLRLLCNLFDGMVAMEGGRRTPTGELWNEVPDRIADGAILIGVGLAAAAWPAAVTLGWAAAFAASLTAYVRALAKSVGLPGLFIGPLAKPQRMAAVTAACLIEALLLAAPGRLAEGAVLYGTLILVLAGSVLTVARRLRRTAQHLRSQPCSPV